VLLDEDMSYVERSYTGRAWTSLLDLFRRPMLRQVSATRFEDNLGFRPAWRRR